MCVGVVVGVAVGVGVVVVGDYVVGTIVLCRHVVVGVSRVHCCGCSTVMCSHVYFIWLANIWCPTKLVVKPTHFQSLCVESDGIPITSEVRQC